MPLPTRRIPARKAPIVNNLLLIKALEELSGELPGVPIVLLKGAALLAGGYREYDEREMADADVLVRSRDLPAVLAALRCLGFSKVAADPHLVAREGLLLDLHEDIWYLNGAELADFFGRCRPARLNAEAALIPAPEDLLIFVLAHAAVHHGEVRAKWIADVRSILRHEGPVLDRSAVAAELERLGLGPAVAWFLQESGLAADWPLKLGRPARWVGKLNFEFKGHFLRFWFLRSWGFRLRYAARTAFPSREFIAARYDLTRPWQVTIYRALRPGLLAFNAISAATSGFVRKN